MNYKSKIPNNTRKFLILIFFQFIFHLQTFAQEKSLYDSWKKSIENEKSNTQKLKLLLKLGSIAAEKNPKKPLNMEIKRWQCQKAPTQYMERLLEI